MCAAIDEAWRAKALRALAAGQRPSDIFRGVGLQLPRTLRLAVHAVMGAAPGRAPAGPGPGRPPINPPPPAPRMTFYSLFPWLETKNE